MTTTATKTASVTKAYEKDVFASPEYNGEDERKPVIQALRGESADQCGYFITEKEMEKSRWGSFKNSDLVSYSYGSGGIEKGLLFQAPRMLVVQRSPLLLFDRAASLGAKKTVFVGLAQGGQKNPEYGTAKYYEVLLLSDNNEPLHEVPLSYLAKGANQATFEAQWRKLVQDVAKLHAIANEIPLKPKNATFAALCVFHFATVREVTRTKTRSMACKVGDYIVPDANTWESFFLGRKETIWKPLLETLEPTRSYKEIAFAE